MGSKLYIKQLFVGCVFIFILISAQARESWEIPTPQRGYPSEVAFVKTDCRLMTIHIGTIEYPPTPLVGLAKVNEVDEDWDHAKVGDEIYDLTSWFPLSEMRTKDDWEEKRWVYYNRSNGYIIANADQFLKSSIHTFVSLSIELSKFNPRFQMIYLEVDEEVELNFESIQRSDYEVLLRGSGILETKVVRPENPRRIIFSSSSGVVCNATVESGFYRRSYALEIKLHFDEHIYYENNVFIEPNRWYIHECGISATGKRKVLAVKVDHVNYYGESVHFPVEELTDMKFNTGLVSDDSEITFSADAFYKAYQVPVDLFAMLPMASANPVTMKDVTKILRIQVPKMDGFFFRSRRLLIAKGSKQKHEELAEFLDDVRIRYSFSRQCVLSFFEIDLTEERKSGLWKIDDLLSVNPLKLGSIGGMLSYTMPAITQSGKSKCIMKIVPQRMSVGDSEILSKVNLELKLKLDLPSLKLIKDVELQVEAGDYKVIQIGKNPTTNKLIMMVINLSELASNK